MAINARNQTINHMEEYVFDSRWIPITELTPPSGCRCIVTDGDSIVIGTYVTPAWLLDGVSGGVAYNIIGWMPTPRPMKKAVPHNDETLSKI